MNSAELKIYTLLTHPTSPHSYHISDDGTKLYVMENGVMVCLIGEGLKEMTPRELYQWYQQAIHRWRVEEIC